MGLVQPRTKVPVLRGIFAARAVLTVLLSTCLLFFEGFAVAADARLDRSADHVHVSAGRAGDSILILLRIDPGYHVNANPASEEYLIPTSIAFEHVAPKRIEYPPPVLFKPAFSDETIKVY